MMRASQSPATQHQHTRNKEPRRNGLGPYESVTPPRHDGVAMSIIATSTHQRSLKHGCLATFAPYLLQCEGVAA